MAYESLPKIAPALFSSEQDLIEVYNKKTDTVGVINPSQISTPLPSGVLSVDNPLSSTLQPIEDKSGTASALSISTNRIGLASDPSVTTQSSSVIAADTANASLVIAPNGTGALIADIPDGTATGGNARGVNAVDLQISRANANEVASGQQSVIVGGYNNRASGNQSVVVGGQNNLAGMLMSFIGGGNRNTITSSGNENVIVGGALNTNSAPYGFIGAGLSNSVSQSYGVVSGGQSNTASTNTHATVVGGQSNTSSGVHSISGGISNTASGAQSVALGANCIASATYSTAIGRLVQATGEGSKNISINSTASGPYSAILGGYDSFVTGSSAIALGYNHTASGTYSLATGSSSNAYLYAQNSLSSGLFSVKGDAQQSSLNARKSDTLTTGGTTTLSLDGTGTTNLIIPNGTNRMWNVQIDTIAVVTTITGTATGVTVGDAYRETKQLLFKRVGGTSSIVGTVDTTAVKNDTSMSTASLVVTAGASQEMALTFAAPTFSGGGSVTCRVVAKVQLVEVAY